MRRTAWAQKCHGQILVRRVITRARQLIDDEGNWIQVYAAVSADDTPVEPFNE